MKTLKNAAFLLLLGLLAISLVGFGIPFTAGGGTYVAKIGDVEIPPQALAREVRARLQEAQGQISPEDAKALGLHRIVLQSLIQRGAAEDLARDLNMTALDSEVAELIREINQISGGGFNQDFYEQGLQRAGWSVEEYEQAVRMDIVRQRLFETLQNTSAPVPDMLPRALARHSLQRRAASYVLIQPAERHQAGEPTEEELATWYEANGSRFETPEKRTGEAVLILPDELADPEAIGDEAVRALFEERRQSLEEPETRTVILMGFGNDREGAEATVEALRAGAPADEVAQARGFTTEDILWQDVTEDELPNPEAAEALFAAQSENTVIGPAEGPLGWYVGRVNTINPGTSVDFADYEAELREELALDRAIDRAFELSDRIDTRLAEGAPSLSAAADNIEALNTVTITTTENLQTPDGDAVPERLQPAARALFEMEEGEISPVREQGENGFFLAELKDIDEASIPALETLREEAVSAWKEEKLRQALREEAEALAAQARDLPQGLEAAAQARSLALIQVEGGVPRSGTVEAFTEQTTSDLFQGPIGRIVVAQARFGDSFVVAEAGNILEPSDDAVQARVRELRPRLNERYKQGSVATFIDEAQALRDLDTNNELIDRTVDQAL